MHPMPWRRDLPEKAETGQNSRSQTPQRVACARAPSDIWRTQSQECIDGVGLGYEQARGAEAISLSEFTFEEAVTVTLKAEEKLLEICDAFASGLSYNNSAKYCGVAPRTLFQWLKMSNAGDPSFIINYCDEQMQFARAMALARKMIHMEIRARLERRSMLGHDEPVFFQGVPTFKPDLRVVGWTEDEREAFGFRRDGLLENEKGKVVQNTIHHEPPIAAQLRVLEMSFSEEYTPSSNVNVVNKDTGVLRANPVTEKMAVPPKPIRPELSAPVELEVLPDEPKENIEDLLGPLPEPVLQQIDPVYDPRPGPNPLVVRGGNRELTEVEREKLRDRL